MHPTEEFELFRWDNYIPPFLKNYAKMINKTYSACHGIGTLYKFDELIDSHNILGGLENIFSYDEDASWIVNIDCDYFFSVQRK